MAVYKVRMPTGHQGTYRARMPTGHLGKYSVYFPGLSEDITIDMTGAPAGAAWTLRNSLSEVVDTGSSGQTQAFPIDATGYTLVWEDTAFPWIPPAPEGPTPLLSGFPITFGPP